MKLGQGYVFTGVCDSVLRGCLPQCMLGYHTPPRADTPWEQTPWNRHPLGADTPTPSPGADTPLGTDTPEQTPPRTGTPWSRHPLPRSRHPLQTPPSGADTHTPPYQSMLGGVSFPLEVEFDFTTWAWVQATVKMAFCGGHFYLYLQCLYLHSIYI